MAWIGNSRAGKWVAAGTAVTAVTGLAVLDNHTSPDVFGGQSYGTRVRFTPTDVARGKTFHAQVSTISVHAPTYRVRLTDARPNVVRNGSAAEVSVSLCTYRPGESFGTFVGDLDEVCSEVIPLDRDVWWDSADANLTTDVVLSITPHQKGTVRVNGVDLTYRHEAARLWRRHTERTNPDSTVVVRRARAGAS